MFETPFYNQHIRNLVSVFGTLFNDIKVQRRDGSGKILETNKVPLAYGPKQKFISRVQGQGSLTDPKMAIKLPRMAFEITSIDYDTTAKLNKQIRDAYKHPTDSYKRQYLRTYAPYNIGFQLSILAKNMDEGLQIVEQILPLFQPDYTVTIIENNNVNRKTDIPFVLTSVDLSEDYEGDFESRRSIIYTLDFTTKLRFFQGIHEGSVIKHVDARITDTTRTPQILLETINVDVDPATAHKLTVDASTRLPTAIDLANNVVTQLQYDTGVAAAAGGVTATIDAAKVAIVTYTRTDNYDIKQTIDFFGHLDCSQHIDQYTH